MHSQELVSSLRIGIFGEFEARDNFFFQVTGNAPKPKSQLEIATTGSYRVIEKILKHPNVDTQVLKLQVWRMDFMSRFFKISSNADGSITGKQIAYVVFDLENPDSFESAKKIIAEIRRMDESFNIYLVCNVDHSAENEQYSLLRRQAGMEYAKANKVPYFEYSANLGFGVEEAVTLGLKQYLGITKSKPIQSIDVYEMTKAKHLFVLFNDAIKSGDVKFLADYCKNGDDRKKFFEIMMFAIADPTRKGDNIGMSAVLVSARNNKPDILDFLVRNAVKDEAGRAMLASHLVQKNQEGKNALHEAASIPNNERCISILCNIAAELAKTDKKNAALADYVNSKDSEYGSTPLHFSVRRCNYSNYVALLRANASKDSKANNGMMPMEVIKFAGLDDAKSFMSQYLATPEGNRYFINRHGHNLQDSPFSPDDLGKLIEIDLNIDLKENSRSQLAAFKEVLRLISSSNIPSTTSVLISNLGNINYLNIDKSELQNVQSSSSSSSAAAELLIGILEKAKSIKETDVKSAFIKAEVFLHVKVKGHAYTNLEAMNGYAFGPLIEKYPHLILNGLKSIDAQYLSSEQKTILAKRIVLSQSFIILNELKKKPVPDGRGKFFSTDNVTLAKNALEQFHKKLSVTTSVADIIMHIESLPKLEHVSELKELLRNEVSDPKFSNSLGIQKP